jgi:hypothetical protein
MDNKQKQADNLFNDCLENIILGKQTADNCLGSFPEQSGDFKSLLGIVEAVHTASAITPRADFRAKARYQFRSALYDAAAKRKQPSWRWSWRMATIIPVAMATLLVTGGGVVAAASGSMPDNPLYPIKLAVEQIQVNLTPSDNARAGLYAMMADRRVNEIISMAQKGNVALLESTNVHLEKDLNRATELAVNGGRNLLAGSMAPAVVSGTSPASNDTQGFGEKAVTTDNGFTGGVITDPDLLKLLLSNSGKHSAELIALLDRVPESAKPAIMRAIELTSNYQQNLDMIASNSASEN